MYGWCERGWWYPNEIERFVLIRPNRIKNADAYVENGITHLMLDFTGPDYDLSSLREIIAWRDSHNGGKRQLAPATEPPTEQEERSEGERSEYVGGYSGAVGL